MYILTDTPLMITLRVLSRREDVWAWTMVGIDCRNGGDRGWVSKGEKVGTTITKQ